MNRQQFVLTAVQTGRNGKKRGMALTKSSTLSTAFRMVYGEKADPQRAVKVLAKGGELVARPLKRGGVMLYLPADAPTNGAEALLAKMGLN